MEAQLFFKDFQEAKCIINQIQPWFQQNKPRW